MMTLTFLKKQSKSHGLDYTKVLEDVIEVSYETGKEVELVVEEFIDKIEKGDYTNE